MEIEMDEQKYRELRKIRERNKDKEPHDVVEHKGQKMTVDYVRAITRHWESLTDEEKRSMI